MDGSLKSIQTQSYACLQDGVCKISRAPQTETWTTSVGLPASRQECKKACIPAEKLKSREQQQQHHQGSFPGICSFPVLYSFGVDEDQRVPAWLAVLLLEDCWCTRVVAVHQEWKVKAPSCLWALLQQRDELKCWNRRARKTGLRSFDSSESKTGHFLKGNRSDDFAQFLSDYKQALQEKKRLQRWGNIYNKHESI